jgi:hypothetical protein
MSHEAGSIVIGWLTKIAVSLAVIGLLVYEAVAIGVAHVSASDEAQAAASAGSEVWQTTHNVNKAFDAAETYAIAHGDTLGSKDFRALPDGSVSLRLHKVATSLILVHIKALHSWIEVSASADAKALTS